MSLTQFGLVAIGFFAVLFVGCLAGEMRDRRNRKPFRPAPVDPALTVRRHALPMHREAAAWLRALAVDALANTATVTRGLAA